LLEKEQASMTNQSIAYAQETVQKAEGLIAGGDLDHAIALLEQVYSIAPMVVNKVYTRALVTRGGKWERQEDYAKALVDYKTAQRIAPPGAMQEELTLVIDELTAKASRSQAASNYGAPNVTRRPWKPEAMDTHSRGRDLLKFAGMVAVVGLLLAGVVFAFRDTIDSVSRQAWLSGSVAKQIVSDTTIALLVGAVETWIFRLKLKKGKKVTFLIATILGGLISGVVTGMLFDAKIVTNSFTLGLSNGLISGIMSALFQTLLLKGQNAGLKWVIFNALTWAVVWAVGWTISWGIGGIGGEAASIAFILIISGIVFSLFLYVSPEVEF
jgi:hypothetical protein